MSKIVERTLDFIELFAEYGRPMSLTEISKILKIPVSSCHDVLQTLLERGYVYELAPRGGFYPTLKLQALATRIVANDPVLPRAELKLRDLRDRFDQSVLLARVDGERATYLMVIEPSYPLRFLRRVGDTVRYLHGTLVGKAILGAMDDRQRKRVIDKLDMVPLAERTVVSREALMKEFETSRQRGWYLSKEESIPTATTISTSFVWAKSTFIINLAGPTFIMDPKLAEISATLVQASAELGNPGST